MYIILKIKWRIKAWLKKQSDKYRGDISWTKGNQDSLNIWKKKIGFIRDKDSQLWGFHKILMGKKKLMSFGELGNLEGQPKSSLRYGSGGNKDLE